AATAPVTVVRGEDRQVTVVCFAGGMVGQLPRVGFDACDPGGGHSGGASAQGCNCGEGGRTKLEALGIVMPSQSLEAVIVEHVGGGAPPGLTRGDGFVGVGDGDTDTVRAQEPLVRGADPDRPQAWVDVLDA